MVDYLIESFVLGIPFLIVGGVFLSNYMRIKQNSKRAIAFDVVSARRIFMYLAKLGAILSSALGISYLLKVALSKIVEVDYSYPLLTGGSIEINSEPFMYSDLALGLVLLALGVVVIIVAQRNIKKLDPREDTYLDKVYLIWSKVMLLFFTVIPFFYAIYENAIYFFDQKYPAVQASESVGQNVNIFQVVDYIQTGGNQTVLLSLKGVNAPGVSTALALGMLIVLFYLKMTQSKKFSAVSVSTPTVDSEEKVKEKKSTKKSGSKKKLKKQ